MKSSNKLAQFAAQTGNGLSRPLYKFLRDMLTGIVVKKSILLSDVGRALNSAFVLSCHLCRADSDPSIASPRNSSVKSCLTTIYKGLGEVWESQ